MSGGGGFRPASRMIISLSAGLEEVCLRSEPICLLQLCSLLPDVGVLRVITGLWWCSRLCLCAHIHTHTLASHTCMLKLNHSHGDLYTHTHSHFNPHMNTHTSSLLTCRCAPLWSRHAFHSLLLLWGPCVPFMTAVTWSMSTFELKLSSRAHMLPKSLLWPVC